MPIFPTIAFDFTAVDADTTLTDDGVYLATSGANGITITLPPIATPRKVLGTTYELAPLGARRLVIIRKVDAGAGAVTVTTADETTIDGIAGATGVTITTQYAGAWFASDGTAWRRVA